jgi:anti-sigma B factor antagonist
MSDDLSLPEVAPKRSRPSGVNRDIPVWIGRGWGTIETPGRAREPAALAEVRRVVSRDGPGDTVELSGIDDDGVAQLRVTGEIDGVNAAEFERALLAVVERAEVGVRVDLTGLDYLGSEGVRALISAQRAATAAKVEWAIEPSPIVRRSLEVAGLHAWITA